jgi:CheY-like chemotaxis protein
LLLLDLQMPEMNGYELMEWIRQQGMGLPVIAFTASMLDAEEKKALYDLGFNAMLPKPFSPAELEVKIGEWLACDKATL